MIGYRTRQVVMLRKWTYLIISGVLSLFYHTHSAQAQLHGQKIEQPQFVTFQSIMWFAENEDYEKISKSLPFLGKITAEIKDRFGVNMVSEIEIALRKRNKATTLLTVHKLIFYDMKNLFFLVEQMGIKSPGKSLTWVKTAYLDYLLLAPKVKRKHFKTHQHIKRLFKQVVSVLNFETSPFAAQKAEVKKRVLRLTEEIEAECLKVFPDFEPS